MIILLIIVLIVVTGFLRDFIFVNINNQMKINSGFNLWTVIVSDHISIIKGMSNDQLNILKWILTIFFTIVYLVISCYLIWYIFGEKKYLRITIISYAVIFVLSFISAVAGYCFDNWEGSYKFFKVPDGNGSIASSSDDTDSGFYTQLQNCSVNNYWVSILVTPETPCTLLNFFIKSVR